jgi:calcium-dependent protein kinase
VGTPYYISPETLDKSRKYDEKCDVWSLGVLAYMLCSGRAPFKGRTDDEIIASVKRGKYTLSSKYWDGVSELAKDFVRKCLIYNPAKRPSAAELLSDPWMLAVRKAGVGADGRSRPLHPEVLRSLRDYSRFPEVKVRGCDRVSVGRVRLCRVQKAALEAIAFSMTTDSIAALRSEFAKLDMGSTGVVTHEQLREVLEANGVSSDEADKIFEGMDLDGSDELSYTEFLAAALSSKIYRDENRLREAFRRLDVDGSGSITAENLQSIMGDTYSKERIHAMIKEADW